MNLVLFQPHEIGQTLAATDPRARHLTGVLRRCVDGDPFDCGLVDGPRGKGFIVGEDAEGLRLRFEWAADPPPLDPVWLLVGLPRPQTVRKILVEATTIGVERMVFFRADRGESSYAGSRLWSSGEVRRHLMAGAGQAFCTRLPRVDLVRSLGETVALFAGAASPDSTRLALDNYEAGIALSRAEVGSAPAALAVGCERGWSPRERKALRSAGFTLAHLGQRILRTETACSTGLAVLKSRLGLLS